MDSKKTWLTLLITIFIIIFIIVTFKFKLYDRFGYWAFLAVITAVGLIYLLALKGFNPKNNALENAAVIDRVNKLLMATPGGRELAWNGGANCKMGYKDFKRENEYLRYWAVLTKSKEDRWFRNILAEKDNVLAEIDGSISTDDMQDIFKGFEPFKSGEGDLMRKLMQGGMFGRKPKRRTMRLTPESDSDYSDEFGDNVPGEVEK